MKMAPGLRPGPVYRGMGAVLVACGIIAVALAAVPRNAPETDSEPTLVASTESVGTKRMSFSGNLTDATTGSPLSGLYDLTFKIYPTAAGGAATWTELQSVDVSLGSFTVLLGSVVPFPDGLFDGGERFLEITVGVTDPVVLEPRVEIARVATSFFADLAADLECASGCVGATELAANAVVSETIANGAIALEDLGEQTIAAFRLADTAIGTADIAADAITSALVGSGEILLDDLNAATVGAFRLSNMAIGTADLAGGSVTSAIIGNGEVLVEDLDQTTIDAFRRADVPIDTADLAPHAVVTDLIADGTILPADLDAVTIAAFRSASVPIDTADLAAGSVSSAIIGNGEILAEDLSESTIDSFRLSSELIGLDDLDQATQDSFRLSSELIGLDDLTIDTLEHFRQKGVLIGAADIANGAVTLAHLADSTIDELRSLLVPRLGTTTGAAVGGVLADTVSLTIGTDGLPLVVYQTEALETRVSHCDNLACSDLTTTVLGSTGSQSNNALGTGVVIAPDGLPLIVFSADGGNWVVECGDVRCATSTRVEVCCGEVYDVVIGIDGLPLLLVRHLNEFSVVPCRDAACSTTGPTLLETTTSSPNHAALAVGADGAPVIAWTVGGAWEYDDLYLARCTDYRCSDRSFVQLASGEVARDGWGLPALALAVSGDGSPTVFFGEGDGDLSAARCDNPACSAVTVSVLVPGASANRVSAAVGPDGMPILIHSTPPELHVGMFATHCTSPACLAATTTPLAVGNQFGESLDGNGVVAIGGDGLPVFAWVGFDESSTSSQLAVRHCSNRFCVPHTRH